MLRALQLHLKFRIDKTHDPVAIVEGLMNYKAVRGSREGNETERLVQEQDDEKGK